MAYITDEILEIFANCISGVESGGQIYGNGDWDNITLQYTNSSEEHAITIGAYQRFATEAKALLSRIRKDYPSVFKKYDTANIGSDLDSKNWNTYQLSSKTCAKAKAIAAIIGSKEGIEIQKKMMGEDTQSYANTIESKYGVHRIDALLHCVNIRHLGGMTPLERIIGRISGEVTLEKVRDSLLKDTKYNQVGAEPYRSRQSIMYKWLHEKVTPLLDTNGLCGSSTTSSRNWLQKGDSGPEVKEMQELLIANGFDCGVSGADGDFGDDTEKAVKAFQAKYGLTVNGQYGEKSKEKLKSLKPDDNKTESGGESMGSINNIIEKERYYASIPYTEIGSTNHQKFSDIVDNAGLMGCQDQAWCATYQFALELEEFGKAQALKNWNMTASNYCGYNVFSTEAKFPSSKKGKTPKIGALVIFKQSHMGRVLSINSSAKTFECGEGNTSNAQYDRNGNACAVKTYSWYDSKIKSFCYIDYDGTSSSTPSSSTSSTLNESPKWNGIVTTTLNVRTWAGSENATVSFSPLKTGVTVGVCDTIQAKDGSDWYYIEYNGKHGFASAKYISKQGESSSTTEKMWLEKGDVGSDVEDLQTKLNTCGYYCGNVDGEFGDNTDKAVKAFQKDNKLSVDGQAGKNTMNLLNKMYEEIIRAGLGDDHAAWVKRLQKAIGAKVDGEAGQETLSKCPLLQNGSTGPVVKLVQEYLGNICKIGVTGGYDGDFGQGTEAAVMEFQKQKGLEIDGVVRQDTWKEILWM